MLDALPGDLVSRLLIGLPSTADIACFLLVSKTVRPLVEDALRLRAQAKIGCVLPLALPIQESSWVQYLMWLDRRSSPPFQISLGYRSAAIVDDGGRLLTLGSVSDEGILGHGPSVTQLATPKLVPMPSGNCRVHFVSMGTAHTLLSTDCGVLSFGIGVHGRLGHGHTLAVSAPQRIESLQHLKKARSVVAGGSHSIVLMDDGATYSFGYGRNGQLGHGNRKDQLTPRRILSADADGPQRWTSIAAGNHHSLALSADGVLWSFGRGFKGRLGHGDDGVDRTRPTAVAALRGKRVTAIAAGDMHSIVLTEEGGCYGCYTFGDGSYGQLGYGTHGESQLSPQRIRTLPEEPLVTVSAGDAHSLVLTQNGHVFGFGSGFSQLPVPPLPWEICHEPDVVSVAASDGVSACAMSDGRIICVGAGWDWLRSLPATHKPLNILVSESYPN